MIGKHVVIDTLDNFKAKLNLIPSSAIVLIKDVGQIYAHGTYFGAQKTYSLLTKTADGLAPKGGTSASSLIKDGATEWVLTVTNGENPSWRRLPDNAFNSLLYTLPAATTTELGGIKVGQVYTATFADLTGNYYKINIDKNGLGYVNIPWTDTKVTNTLLTKDTKFYLTGTTSDSTNTSTLVFDSRVYVDVSNGNLVAGSFLGNLSGNATSATSAGKLKNYSIVPFGSATLNKWFKFSTIKGNSRYATTSFLANVYIGKATTNKKGDFCTLSFYCYLQNALGSSPAYLLIHDNTESLFIIRGVLNYNESGYTIDLYAKVITQTYQDLHLCLIGGNDVITTTNTGLSELPSGTEIIPTYSRKVLQSEESNSTNNILGGAQGSIPFLTATGTTSFIEASSTNDYILRYSTTNKKPYWAEEKNDNNAVKQTNTSTLDEDFRVLFSYSANDTTLTEGARKSSKLKFNPVTGTLISTILKGNLDGSYIDKLTGYTIALLEASISASDSLVKALGKLEYKLDSTYNWYKGVIGTDEDEIINKWDEIVDFVKNVSEGTDLVDEFVTRKTDLTITGLKTFESNSNTVGVSLILKNKGWLGNMSTAVDFYNGNGYAVPNARIETKMVGNGKAGGTLIFYTQSKHDSTNPNPNGLTERLRIDDLGIITASTDLLVNKNITGAKLITIGGTSSQFLKGDGTLDSNLYYSVKGLKYDLELAWDWNDITEYGTYKIQSGTSIANHPKRDDVANSYPFGLALILKGKKDDVENRITLVYFPHNWASYNDIPLYLRMRNGANLTWTSWAKIPSVDFVTKLCNKYLPLTGGTLTGNTSISNEEPSANFSVSSKTSKIALISWGDSVFIEAGNKTFNENVPLYITGYNSNVGSTLFLKFETTDIYGVLKIGGNIIPNKTLSYSLGSTDYRWNCLNAGYANLTSTLNWLLTLKNTDTSGNVLIAYINAKGNTWTTGANSIDIFLFVYNNETTKAIGFNTEGLITCNGFNKRNSSDSYVLLGGGGHKKISDLLLTSELTTFEKTLNVTSDWMDTGIAYDNLPADGTYIVQVSVKANDSTGDMWSCYWGGVMVWYVSSSNTKTNDTETDEILLHRSGHAYLNTIYLRTVLTMGGSSSEGVKLQIAANKNIGKEYKYTFKFKRII